MPPTAPPLGPVLPARRPDLIVRPDAEDGAYVVKVPWSGAYYQLGAEEHFLLSRLDGTRGPEEICAAFAERFGQALLPEELDEFLEMARSQGFLRDDPEARRSRGLEGTASPSPRLAPSAPGTATSRPRQSILSWRTSLCDPDRLFTWLAPKLTFFWTRGFLIVSAGCIALAALILWANRHELASNFAHALRWETAVWVALVLFAVTVLHESAHGLTCKHYGGEVHDVGFLLLLFMPCFYCNVSDAWLFRERSKRLWVTFAGGYFELFVWSLAVFAWRLTPPGSHLHSSAFLVVSACGVATLFNFNPLLKLDGYYLLSDWLGVPNLQQRGLASFKGRLRRWLWGAPRPEPGPRDRLLLGYGMASWVYSLAVLTLMLWSMVTVLGASWGWLGVIGVVLLAAVSLPGLFRGVSAGEVQRMIRMRRKRTGVWLLGMGGLVALASLEIEDRAGGSFHLRAGVRAEVRAPVSGFIRVVGFDEGNHISPGAVVVRLEIPDLESRLVQKRAEIAESRAKLRLLEIGPRPEEVVEQRRRVERAERWRDLARQDLARRQRALAAELARLDRQIAADEVELEGARELQHRNQALLARGAFATAEYRDSERATRVARARLEQAHAERRSREAEGTLEAEAELARREKELAEARSALALLEAGTRPEEVQAERARLMRLQEEARYLDHLGRSLLVSSPVAGLIATPRLRERVGQYVREGDLLCLVEQPAGLEAEIALDEQRVARVHRGQRVRLRARGRPLEVMTAAVDRIAPTAARPASGTEPETLPSRITVYCRLDRSTPDLRPGMTGYARIDTGRRPIGRILLDRVAGLLRTEFWW